MLLIGSSGFSAMLTSDLSIPSVSGTRFSLHWLDKSVDELIGLRLYPLAEGLRDLPVRRDEGLRPNLAGGGRAMTARRSRKACSRS